MKTSLKGIELNKQFEGFRSKPYICSGGVATIGYGSTRYLDGTPVKMTDNPITRERADELLLHTLKTYENIVKRRVTIPLNQNQFDALVLHTYNTGGSNNLFSLINRQVGSSIIKLWWTTRYITAGGKQLQGLVNRRAKEYELYITPIT